MPVPPPLLPVLPTVPPSAAAPIPAVRPPPAAALRLCVRVSTGALAEAAVPTGAFGAVWSGVLSAGVRGASSRLGAAVPLTAAGTRRAAIGAGPRSAGVTLRFQLRHRVRRV